MAALTAFRKTPQKGDAPVPTKYCPGVKASTKVYQGGMAVLSSGYAKPGATATGLVALGRFETTVDNSSGANGDLTVEVTPGVFKWGNSASTDLIAVADAGKDCYIVDDQTVALTDAAGTRSKAGRIVGVDTDGVWVLMGLGYAGSSGIATPSIQTGTITLATGTKALATGIEITAASKVYVSLNTPAGGTQGVKYKVPDASLVVGAPGTGAFTATAVDNAGATVATDTSTLNYLIVG